jgi:predicted dehydrogenase
MNREKIVAGFVGAGGIAKSHVYALNSINYYYDNSPAIELESVCSLTKKSRDEFAARYGFAHSQEPAEFLKNKRIDSVFILGPNKVHYEYFKAALEMPSIKRVYLEKPICSTPAEEKEIRLLAEKNPGIKIQVGFQYLFSSQIMGALSLWQSGKLGKPVHFDIKYYHGDYLRKDYRDKRTSRLTPAPDGGAMADLGSHAISLLIAFLGDKITVMNALQAGHFQDVPADSDLFSLITLTDPVTRAAGTISASRISSGTGDMISFELFCEKGALRLTTHKPDCFEYFLEDTGIWSSQSTGSNYRPFTTFPSGHVPPGWFRSMIHAHYVFLTGNYPSTPIPGLDHGLAVQRILRLAAGKMNDFRLEA